MKALPFSLRILLFAIVAPRAFAAAGVPATVETYPLPSVYQASRAFSIRANGKEVPVVNYSPDYDYAQFSMAQGACTIEITAKSLRGNIEACTVSPLQLGLPVRVIGRRLTFTIEKDEYLIVWVKGAPRLVIAADAAETGKPPPSGPGIYNVRTQYHADNSGHTLATAAIQQAINDAARAHASGGQGIVYVPAGVFKIGNLELKSNVALYLEGGSVLLGSGVPGDYKVQFHKDSMKRDGTWCVYTEDGAKNVKIYGRGTIDGVGKDMAHSRNFLDTVLMVMGCEQFELDGIVMRDSGVWANIVARSKNIAIRNYKIFNRLDTGENDGLDICESQNVLVDHSIGISLDDPFSTKTWEQRTDIAKTWYGRPEKLENVTFDHCLAWTRCYAFKVGQGVVQDQDGIIFQNSVVYDCAVGVGIHHKWGTGVVTNVTFRNIDIENVQQQNLGRVWAWFKIDGGDRKGGGPVSNVNVENIRVRDLGKTPGLVRGFSDQSTFTNVRFSNIVVPGSDQPARTLEEMGITDTGLSKNVRVE